MAAFIPQNPLLTHVTGGWVGHRATVNVAERIFTESWGTEIQSTSLQSNCMDEYHENKVLMV